MSNSSHLLSIQLKQQAGELICGEQSVVLRHHKAALFLDGLIAASQQGEAFSRADFLSAWAALDPQTIPDRTAIRRIVQAVREGLDAVLPDGAARLVVPTRGLTTGPWRLTMLADEQWLVDAPLPSPSHPEPTFTVANNPLAWHDAANALAMADAMLKEGQYLEAVHLLQTQMNGLGLSDSGWCLWALRLVRVQRRLGRYSDCGQILQQLDRRAAQMPWRMRAYVVSKAALLRSRTAFDDAPLATSLRVDFDKLRAVVDAAPNVALQWEWCNLRALSYRRQIQRQLQAGAAKELVQGLANEAVQTFGAAYFWAAIAKDSYHGQAIACNFAYTLHWLDSQGLYDGLSASIAWFRLAHTLIDRFDLPQDSAWDFLMLGDLYLNSAKARALIDADVLSWPEQTNPAKEDFYLRSLDLARKYGNARQQIMALNQQAGFLHQQGLVARRQQVRAARDALMSLHSAVLEDMVKDGFESY